MRTVKASLEALLEDSAYDPLTDCYLLAELSSPSPLTDPMGKLRLRFPHILHLRVPRPEVTHEGSELAERQEAPDLETDLRAFWADVSGAEPDDAVMTAFSEVRAALAREGGAA